MPIGRTVRRAPNYCPQCGGTFGLKAAVARLSRRSEIRYLQCRDCKQIIVCNFKIQHDSASERVA